MSETRRVEAVKVLEALQALKAEGYNVLVDMTAVDYSAYSDPKPVDKRFDVIYQVMKLNAQTGMDEGRVELHCSVDETPVLYSAASLWPAADWLEREIWDMFGIGFVDRPNLKRILMY